MLHSNVVSCLGGPIQLILALLPSCCLGVDYTHVTMLAMLRFVGLGWVMLSSVLFVNECVSWSMLIRMVWLPTLERGAHHSTPLVCAPLLKPTYHIMLVLFICCASNVGLVQIIRIPTICVVPCHNGANFGLLSSAMIDFWRTYWQPSSYICLCARFWQ